MTEEIDLKDIFRILRKRIGWILSFTLIATIGAAIISYFVLTPVYEASTKLIVNKSADTTLSSQQMNINDLNFNLRLIDTYKEIIKTSAIMDKVAAQYPQFHLSGDQLIGKINVSAVNNSQVMTLNVQDPSYKRAAEIVNAVAKVFQQEISNIMKVDNVSILNEAKVADTPAPIKPNKLLNIAISFILSLMIVIGVIFLLEFLDDTIKTEANVENDLELPILATIPKFKAEDLIAQHSQASKPREVNNVKLSS